MNGIIRERRAGPEINQYTPNLDDVVINEFFIGHVQDSVSSVSEGTTRTYSFTRKHFGLSIHNQSPNDVIVEVLISELDREGYSIGERSIYGKVYGGQKKRLWDRKGFEKSVRYGNQLIKSIKIELSRENTIEIKPNVTIFKAMGYKTKKKRDFKILRLMIRYGLIAIVLYFTYKFLVQPFL